MKEKLKKKKDNNTVNEFQLYDKLITSEFKYEYVKELIRSLRTKILMGLHDITDKSLVITSLNAEAGKSTIASNIALSIAQQDKKTVLIDGDLRRGSLHNFFQINQRPGLSDLLSAPYEVSEEAVSGIIRKTHVPDLFLITAGEFVAHSSELLTTKRFTNVKEFLSKQFEIIIIDTPPLGAVTDAVVINELFSKYIVVVKAGSTNVIDMKKKIREFPSLEKKILGLVLNYAAMDKIRAYYKRSKYY